MKVLTIIVSYNFEPWLEQCLGSLCASIHPTDIMVIDNGSKDRTIERIRVTFPHVKLIANNANLGFGKANNIGMQLALQEGYDAVFLLNQDAWIDVNTIGTLCTMAKRYPTYGILSPVHLDGSAQALDKGFASYVAVDSIASLPSTDGMIESRFINAAFWFIPTQVLQTVGGFSPLFYHYGEDKDYINRLHYHQYKVGYSPSVFGCHDRAFRKVSPEAFYRTERVYHLSEYANINYSFLQGFAYGILAVVKKSMQALWHGKAQKALRYIRIATGLLQQTGHVIRIRKETIHKHPNYIEP